MLNKLKQAAERKIYISNSMKPMLLQK